MVRLNQDHSLSPLLDQLVAQGKMTREEAETDPRRHYLRSALTGEDLELVDLADTPLSLLPGDILIVASDGLLTLAEADVCRIVSANAANGPDAIADALLLAVDRAGAIHQDNTTVVAIEVSGSRPTNHE